MAAKKSKARTHIFRKEIVTEGKYPQRNRLTGETFLEDVPSEKLERAVHTFELMTAKGLKVPAPWKHDFEIHIETGDEGILKDSTRNAGFWKNLWTEVNDKGKTVLVGNVEVPGDPEDPETPAGKVGTQVKDTSVYLRKKYELTDGSGEFIEDALMHIALVTHPIESGQKNFELLDPNDSYIAMSEMVMDDIGDINELSALLKKVCKIHLSQSTTVENLVPNLINAVKQIALTSDDEDDDSPDSYNTKFETEPLVMATLSKEAIESILKTKAVNPATGKPFTVEDLTTEVVKDDPAKKQQELVMSALQSCLQDDRRKVYRDRINSLIETGRCTKSFADTSLFPKADGYALSFENGRVVTPMIEELIMSLESVPVKDEKPQGEGQSAYTEGSYISDETELSVEEMDKIADQMLAY